jgi:hypothetical protein
VQHALVERELQSAESALLVDERALQEELDLLDAQRAQHEDARPREQRPVDLEARVLGRGADQHHRAVLDRGQQAVLLRLVEAMDLVHEEDRPARRELLAFARLAEDLAQPRHALADRAEGHELARSRGRDEARQRRLARTGRPPEHDRAQGPLLDRAAQRLARPEQLLLPRELLERARSHARGERLGRSRRLEQARIARGLPSHGGSPRRRGARACTRRAARRRRR